jgi:hypothetical protein
MPDLPPKPRRSCITRNQFGAFCSACQSPLSCEEDDWDECDTCGGEGIGCDDVDWSDDDA